MIEQLLCSAISDVQYAGTADTVVNWKTNTNQWYAKATCKLVSLARTDQQIGLAFGDFLFNLCVVDALKNLDLIREFRQRFTDNGFLLPAGSTGST